MTQRKPDAGAQPVVLMDSQSARRGQLSQEQLAAIESYIKQVGGVDNARQALATLLKLEKAA